MKANDKLSIAIIGVGGHGMANLQDCKAENVVSLCDVSYAAATLCS